ncbi:MAG: type III-A CRISPR-associated RAMP protein Csm3 [Deltaproteobacteria bacterium]|nr:MAG: type III-A CRISPR-associated RAMP protein Csm3 [Deltaproteobacteria bacterium]
MNVSGKLKKKVFLKGTINAETGISVGGSSTGLEIGGADKVVVRNPLTNAPYIPGSSLKGKMRSLLEKLYEKMTLGTDGEGNQTAKPCKCGKCPICEVFGVSAEDKGIPARLIVRDSMLTKDSFAELENSKTTDMPFTEVKTEVAIDRITSAANPRSIERVPGGAEFDLSMVCNIYADDNEEDILCKVFEGLRLVQDDYLGGSGSRGYGQVKFRIEPLTYKDQGCYENNAPEEALGIEIPSELL